jgi:ribonuclease R
VSDAPATTDTSADEARAIRKGILDFLAQHADTPYRSHEIARQLGYEDDNETYLRFCDVLADLRAKKLIRRKGHKFQHKPGTNQVTGVLRVNPQGYGFVEPADDDERFFVRETNMKTALDGDVVRVAVGARPSHHPHREAEVVEVVERRRTQVVGTFQRKGHYAFVDPDDQRIFQDVFVPEAHFGGAKDGQKVMVSIDRFDNRKASPEGRVLRVIGDGEDPDVRVLALAMSMDVKADFPEPVLKEARAIPDRIAGDALRGRLDLRHKRIFTIDPDDAKDFDDAIHLDRLDNGDYELGVHIADVSHYVEEGTALDEEAYARATSVYLVDRTVPMLPEKLSNKVCSLRPEEDKLAFSCIMTVSPQGDVKDYQIRETVIHSKRRLTYDEAQTFIQGGYPDDPVAPDVVQANRLARTLTKKRMREGSVDFDLPEVKVVLDEKGVPQEVVRKERMDANRLVEEFMLLANRTVARHVGGKQHERRVGTGRKDPLPFVYRVHDTPDAEQIQQLAEYVRIFGHRLKLTDGNATSQDLNALIAQVKGKAEEPVVTRAALRAMSKAVYGVGNIGHYGLGFAYYSHFTSPIRRYPDLMVHRLLKRYATDEKPADAADLAMRCEHCSEQERNAVDAERESVKLKQVEYAERHVGETFDGVVSGVTKFGVFVEMTDLLVEGLVHVREMNDYYVYDESTFTLRGEKKGQTYQPGDQVTVKLTNANVEKRQIDLVFAS